MPKMKTRRTAKKRIKVSGTGKLLRQSTKLNHLMLRKDGSATRRLQQESEVESGHRKAIKRMLGL
jgi:large subunit ribosomal protein L35